MKILIIIFTILSITTFGQTRNKVDSVFKHYFKALDLELSKKKDLNRDSLYFDKIVLNDGEVVFVNKYANEAMVLLQRLSEIKTPNKYIAQSHASFVDKRTLRKWKHWYIENKKNINWCYKEKKVYLIK